ncbi:MAG: aminotransferase class V-fold PLP-dependent enzyme [Deltaproteobacteria bacterium]|nr:aminotransferase class V-fold PLP-dependent enzyme [Deltaproteobacteria bacterium]
MIYLDNNATTRVLPEVMEAMLPFYTELWGNPSSLHPFGAQVAKHIDKAREQAAALLGAQRESEIVFTSGGTESNNLAIRGTLLANPGKKHIVTTPVEHPSVLLLCQQMEKEGYEVTYALDHPEKSIGENTALVSVMWANNETGVIFPIEKIAAVCREKNVPLHVDATQAAGKIPIDLRQVPVSLLSISGHKLHAPKGIGALYVRRGTRLNPLFHGGHQERSRRAGTENVAGIVGFGKACELAQERLKNGVMEKITELRDRFEKTLAQKFPWIRINGKENRRLPNTSSISFERLEGEAICLLLGEENICVSTGSACSAGSLEPSHVLKAMGLNAKQARGTVRFSLGFETTQEEINQTINTLEKIIWRLKRTS